MSNLYDDHYCTPKPARGKRNVTVMMSYAAAKAVVHQTIQNSRVVHSQSGIEYTFVTPPIEHSYAIGVWKEKFSQRNLEVPGMYAKGF
jgi:hypothetical protein